MECSMRLSYIKFSGYKRFSRETTLNLNSKMIALIGPNEAGKTSILKMLAHISTDTPFSQIEKYKHDAEASPKLLACFFLERSDHSAINSEIPKRLFIKKTEDGTRSFSFEPEISRPKSNRRRLLQEITRSLKNKTLIEKLEELEEIEAAALLENFKTIDLEKENLDIDEIEQFENFSAYLLHEEMPTLPKYITSLSDKILKFTEEEATEHPNFRALEECKARIPAVIEFTQEDRKLDTTYNMNGYQAPQNQTTPCNALLHLATLTDLNLGELKTNLEQNSFDQIEEQIRNANEKLKELFSQAWSQADIKIHFAWNKPEIHIMVEERNAGQLKFSPVDQRSDGLRQYIALFAFIIKQDIYKPILLIDEAELHLHYDAQADLIQTLTRKNLASKIIYTTHSAGCLPEDLGNGVKLVIPENNDVSFSTSRVENKFWNSKNLGFSPILYGMGANTLAFFPTRKAVIVEGQSDPLLIPTVFRQISGLEFNSFQIVPGMANIAPEHMPRLAVQGERVSYLVDNDPAGSLYLEQLQNSGIPKNRLFKVCSSCSTIITIEDWIDDDVFYSSVETYRNRYYPNIPTPPAAYFSGDGKAEKLNKYEKKYTVKISKVDLAYIILETVEKDPTKPIFNKRHSVSINNLRKKILKSFEA